MYWGGDTHAHFVIEFRAKFFLGRAPRVSRQTGAGLARTQLCREREREEREKRGALTSVGKNRQRRGAAWEITAALSYAPRLSLSFVLSPPPSRKRDIKKKGSLVVVPPSRNREGERIDGWVFRGNFGRRGRGGCLS